MLKNFFRNPNKKDSGPSSASNHVSKALRFLQLIVLNAVISSILHLPVVAVETAKASLHGDLIGVVFTMGILFLVISVTLGTNNLVTSYCLYHLVVQKKVNVKEGVTIEKESTATIGESRSTTKLI